MILAAGLGTRLRPLTDRIPKALVPVAGIPVLERNARRLVAAGADRLVINVHPFAEAIRAHVAALGAYGVDVRICHEVEAPLETGGGLLAARPAFRAREPFFVHNADIYTDLDLVALYAAHARSEALATLATMERPSTRGLLFDDHGLLGHANDERGTSVQVRTPQGPVQRLAFACVHVIEPAFFDQITEQGRFGIFEPYLRLAAVGARILPHRVDGCTWVDIGRPDQLAHADALAGAGPASP
ncbi:MAG: sugar phosphate nucleotidyltransferase [Planctomycetota bacterium]|nr:sugar phosphate nucleotidyltransferase [Planctomycetota bacterium]